MLGGGALDHVADGAAGMVPHYNRTETSGSQFWDERKEIMVRIVRIVEEIKIVGIIGFVEIEVALNLRFGTMTL